MKKFLTTLTALLFFSLISSAQITIYDGETIVPDFWDIGGNPPNGADCPVSEGWTLTNIGKSDILTEGLANPYPDGLNTTEKVVRTVRAVNGEGWAGAALDVSGLGLNISVTNKFSVLIYKAIEGNVTMKLEGAGSQEVTVYYNTPGQWQKLEFIFDAVNFTGSPTTLLVFPHNQTGLTETILTYWDEVTMYDATDNPTVIYNGNDPVSGFFIDGYWAPNGSLNNLETDLFPNLDKTGINTSNHVIRFLRAKDGESWCGMGLGGLDIDISTTPMVSLMVLKSMSGRVAVKLEGTGSQEVYADYTTPGVWTRLNFSFDSGNFSGHPNTIIIMPHFEETNLNNLADHTPMYIDNILLRDATTLPTDYFRTKNSGNWSDAATWESSFNNANWVSAISSPGNTASNTEIITGHTVTADVNINTTDLTVSPGAKLTLNSGIVLNTSTLNLQSNETNGTATFVDNGTFSSNNVFVQQYLTGGRNWYLSSPVSTANSSDFSSAETVYSYNETNGSWDAENASSLIPMKGYISAATTGDGVITFNGTLNTGNQSILLTRSASNTTKPGFNLVGNPYPSYVNWELATKTDLNNTIWYRTQNSSGTYVFDTFNGIGTNNNESGEVTQYIPPFQAFWVRVNEGSSNGTLAFENSMRSHENGTNRLKAPAQNTTDQQIIRLQVSNETNKDETIILFNENASDEFDSFDSPKMTNANIRIPEIFTTIGAENLVINGMNKLSANKELPLGFTTGESNTFTLKITEVKNLGTDTRIILNDKILNIKTDITDGIAYNFSSEIVNNSTRFSIIFKTQTFTTLLNKTENPSKEIAVFLNSENHLVINSNLENSKESAISIFNISGQKIYNSVMNKKSVVVNQKFNPGIYLVKVESSDNYYTAKITIN